MNHTRAELRYEVWQKKIYSDLSRGYESCLTSSGARLYHVAAASFRHAQAKAVNEIPLPLP